MPNADLQNVDWLFTELDALVEKDIISAENAGKMRAYYRVRKEAARAARERQAELHQKRIPIFMAVVAAMLVAAGGISLGAYNWYRIGRSVKAALDIGLLALLQAGAFFLLTRRGRPLKTWLREGFALFYALLFGGLVAFAAQIYRLPSNPAGFFLIWTISTLLIMYAFDSAGTFFLALALICAYVVTAQKTHGHPALFYPLLAAVLPFAAKQKYGMHGALAVYAAMLGIALEKSVPGLWIVCYGSSAALCVFYGAKKDDAGIQYAGIVGLAVLGVLLALPDAVGRAKGPFWYGIGWRHYRAAEGAYFYRLYKNYIDGVIAAVLTAGSVAVPLADWMQRRPDGARFPLLPLIPSGAAALYAVCSAADRPAVGNYAAAGVFAAVLACGLYGLHRMLYAKDVRWLPAVLAAVAVLFVYFAQSESSEYLYDYFSMLAASVYLYRSRKTPAECAAADGRTDSVKGLAAVTAAVLFLFSNADIIRADAHKALAPCIGGCVPLVLRAAMILCAALFMAAAVYACRAFILEKRRFNPFIALSGLFSAAIVLGTQTGALQNSPVWSGAFRFMCMLAFALYHVLDAVKTGSLFGANGAALYLTGMILLRFFNSGFSLLSKGILFIACGVLIFIGNIALARRKNDVRSNEIAKNK